MKTDTQNLLSKLIEEAKNRPRNGHDVVEDAFFNFMVNHPDVVKYANDQEFMIEIYQSLTNTYAIADPELLLKDCSEADKELVFVSAIESGNDMFDVSRSFRSAGGFVAMIRNHILGTSEEYMDWYCSGPESYLSERIALIYDEIGIKWSVYES